MELTASTLRNRGCPVDLAELGPDGLPRFTSEDEPICTRAWIRFDINVLVAVEERWGDFAGLQKALGEHPAATIREMFSLVLGDSPEAIGRRMLHGRLSSYAEAIGAAYATAIGVDPQVTADAYNERKQTVLLPLVPEATPSV